MEKEGAGKHWYGFMKMCAGCAIGKQNVPLEKGDVSVS